MSFEATISWASCLDAEFDNMEPIMTIDFHISDGMNIFDYDIFCKNQDKYDREIYEHLLKYLEFLETYNLIGIRYVSIIISSPDNNQILLKLVNKNFEKQSNTDHFYMSYSPSALKLQSCLIQ